MFDLRRRTFIEADAAFPPRGMTNLTNASSNCSPDTIDLFRFGAANAVDLSAT